MSTETRKPARRTALLVGIPLLALGGTVAIAAPGGFGAHASDGFRGDGPGFRGHHGHHPQAESAEELRDHMDMGLRFLSAQVDASEEQEAEISAILDEVAPAAWDLRLEAHGLRADVAESLAEGQVDQAELELARQDGLDLADRASALMLDAFVDVSSVLTMEQRAELADLHRRWHR